MRQLLFTILFLMLLSFSCKKEEKLLPEHFMGTWDWEYTIIYYTNGDGSIIKQDTIFPIIDVDFNSEFEVTKKGRVNLFQDDFKFLAIEFSEMYYTSETNPVYVSYRTKDDFSEERGEYQLLYIEGNLTTNYCGVYGFPIGGGIVGNETSLIYVGGGTSVYNVFKRSQ